MEILKLKQITNEVRNILEEVHSAKSGHPGGSLSVNMLTYLYFEEMNIDAANLKP